MKDMLLNTFDPVVTSFMSLMLVMGILSWTSKSTLKPLLSPKPSLQQNKFM